MRGALNSGYGLSTKQWRPARSLMELAWLAPPQPRPPVGKKRDRDCTLTKKRWLFMSLRDLLPDTLSASKLPQKAPAVGGSRQWQLCAVIPAIRAGARRSRKRTFEPAQTGYFGSGGVDRFKPVSGGGDWDHAERAFGELIISRGDGASDFQAAEEAFDAIAFPGKRPLC